MSDKVNCPFCGNVIENDAYRCNTCGSLFTDPELPDIKFKDFATFVALLVLTFGLFGIIWTLINIKAINQLTTNNRDGLKLNILIAISLLDIFAYMLCLAIYPITNLVPVLTALQCIIFMAITYRVLRIIQKYTQKNYDVTLEFNPYYIVFFNILYLSHFIDTYSNRVMQIHEHFNAKSPQMILFIILLLIIQFVMCMKPEVHQFYKWLFGL